MEQCFHKFLKPLYIVCLGIQVNHPVSPVLFILKAFNSIQEVRSGLRLQSDRDHGK